MNELKISELTVSQFRRLIRKTVQEAVAEVIIEFNAVAAAEEKLQMEAELAEYLRTTMQNRPYDALFNNTPSIDD
jgi:hypothetical protein